jgi:glycosyltransferase involved in cell wall biosynthesis
LRVLFQSRTTLFSVSGGDTVQISKTAAALRILGCHVDISTDLEPDVSSYDLVHLFNLTRPQELLLQICNASKHGKKLALSPIYVDYSDYERNARRGYGRIISRSLPTSTLEYCKTIARAVKNGEFHQGTLKYLVRGHRAAQLQIIRSTDMFLPNSEHEMQRVMNDFPPSTGKPYVVVPNAVDPVLFKADLRHDLSRNTGLVLCVARIEGLKNQLNLVLAMRGLPFRLLLIGKAAPNHKRYFREIKKVAGPNVDILDEVTQEQLPAYYAAAKVHVLPSWMETTGLSSLEAGAMGCNLVITDKGDTREYFGDAAFYCEPDSVESIRDAIIRAYAAPAKPDLQKRIVRDFTWEKAAERTLRAYETLLRNQELRLKAES